MQKPHRKSLLCKYLKYSQVSSEYIFFLIYFKFYDAQEQQRTIIMLKKKKRKKQKVLASFYNIPFFCNIVRVQADFAHLKSSITNAFEIKGLRKLGCEQYWSLSLIFRAKRRVTKEGESVGVFWLHQFLKNLEVALLS